MNKGHTFPADWWAFGVLLYELVAGLPPFMDDDRLLMFKKTCARQITWPKHFSPASVLSLSPCCTHCLYLCCLPARPPARPPACLCTRCQPGQCHHAPQVQPNSDPSPPWSSLHAALLAWPHLHERLSACSNRLSMHAICARFMRMQQWLAQKAYSKCTEHRCIAQRM